MARFQYKTKQRSGLRTALAIVIFLVIIAIFYCAINSLSSSTEDKERESLENALSNSITYCYATEGAYPESLEFIEKNYGLTYDENKYFIDYRVMGANIMPEFTVVEVKQ